MLGRQQSGYWMVFWHHIDAHHCWEDENDGVGPWDGPSLGSTQTRSLISTQGHCAKLTSTTCPIWDQRSTLRLVYCMAPHFSGDLTPLSIWRHFITEAHCKCWGTPSINGKTMRGSIKHRLFVSLASKGTWRARGISSHPTFLVLISNPHEKGGRDMFNEIGRCTLSPPPPPPPPPSPKVLTPFMMWGEESHCTAKAFVVYGLWRYRGSDATCPPPPAATRHPWRKTDVTADPLVPVPLDILSDSSCTYPPLCFRLSLNQSNFGILSSDLIETVFPGSGRSYHHWFLPFQTCTYLFKTF